MWTDDFVGQLIDRKYHLLSVLGRGGMGVVYRAEQLDADGHPFREVALKALLPHFAVDQDFSRRFLREVQVTAQLDSLHTVAVHDCGRGDGGQLYYTMELVRGQTLKEVLQQQGKLSVERAIRIAGQICIVLAEAHSLPNPVVHRDLKPANIFVEQRQGQERVKICDFGIAKVLREHTTRLTHTGHASLGTPHYMAPEQWQGEAVDGRTDLYALGVILYEMLTGRPPFTGDDGLLALMMQHVHKPPLPLPTILPPGLRILVERLLAKAPQQRPTDALSVQRALATALDQEDDRPTVVLLPDNIATVPPKPPPQMPAPPPKQRQSWRRLLVAVTAGVSLAALAALSPWAYSRWQQAEAERQAQLQQEETTRWAEAQQQAEVAEAERQAQLQQEEAARRAEARRQAEAAEDKRQAEVARQRAEAEEARRQAEAAEARRQAEEASRQAEAAAEAKRKAEEEAKKQMVAIPAGDFFMGCNEAVDQQCNNDEKPGRQVYLDAFSIDKYGVTVADYRQCVEAGGCSLDGLTQYYSCNWNERGRVNHPITCVDWNQARQYCQWAGKRLPTEAEWEKAARGPEGLVYPWGNQWDRSKANVGGVGTVPVGSYPPGKSYAVYDMAGNVWEWMADWYDGNYYKWAPSRNPKGPDSGQSRVLRGGSWLDAPRLARTATRNWDAPGHRFAIGFRCAQ